MKLHRGIAALLASALALVVWGCTGEQVENSADATARGLDKGGRAIESAGQSAGQSIKNAGTGTKLENAAATTGNALDKGGEKTHELMDKAGDKIKDAAPAVGRAVDKAGEKVKDGGPRSRKRRRTWVRRSRKRPRTSRTRPAKPWTRTRLPPQRQERLKLPGAEDLRPCPRFGRCLPTGRGVRLHASRQVAWSPVRSPGSARTRRHPCDP